MLKLLSMVILYYPLSIGLTFYQKWFIKVCATLIDWIVATAKRDLIMLNISGLSPSAADRLRTLPHEVLPRHSYPLRRRMC